MSLRNKFAMAPSLEQQGVQFEIDNARITVARAGGTNMKYIAAMEKVYREHGRAIEKDLIGNEKAGAVARKVYVDTIILNWETMVGDEYKQGLEDFHPDAPDDAPLLPFTPENVDGILRTWPDLLAEIRSIADNVTLYRQTHLDGVRKN